MKLQILFKDIDYCALFSLDLNLFLETQSLYLSNRQHPERGRKGMYLDPSCSVNAFNISQHDKLDESVGVLVLSCRDSPSDLKTRLLNDLLGLYDDKTIRDKLSKLTESTS